MIRKVLALAALLAMVVVLSGVYSSGSVVYHINAAQQNQVELGNSNNTRTPVKHVINIFLENHSFDNLFGVYPSVNVSGVRTVEKNLTVPLNLLGHSSAMNRLTAVPRGTFNTANPIEGWVAYHQDWNNGAMNGFLNGSGKQALTYFTASQMAPEWALAQQYGLAANYYSEQITESSPNHLYYLAGYSPVFNDYGPPPYIPFHQSMMGQLSSNSISWAFFIQNPSKTFADWHYFSGIQKYSSDLRNWTAFSSEVKDGSLPAVSWLFSQGPGNYSQGSPASVLNGELWLLHVVDMIENSPVWPNTVIFITYDEFGGYYDQVSPPVFHGIQLGFRIPLIVISPYAKEDYVSNTLLTHTSLLAFVDYNWKMKALNRAVQNSNIPLDFFSFPGSSGYGGTPRSPLSFGSDYGFPVPASMFFSLNRTMINFDYASHFPLDPQIPFSELNYSRTGSSQVNLSGSGVFITENTPYIPFYDSDYFLVILVLVEVAVASATVYKIRRRDNE